MYARFGTRVTALDSAPHILPSEDEDLAVAIAPALEEDGIGFVTGATIERAAYDERGWRLQIEGSEDVRAEALLIAAGREPCFDTHDLSSAGVHLDGTGRPILSETLRTTAPSIWAAGDATGELLFTHVGTYEAGVVVDDIVGRPRSRDYATVPRVTYSDPEVASVGLTEEGARDAGYDVTTAVVPMASNDRARIDGSTFGVVKLVADANTRDLLGGHIVADQAGTMIHEVVAMMAGGIDVRDIATAIARVPDAFGGRDGCCGAARRRLIAMRV